MYGKGFITRIHIWKGVQPVGHKLKQEGRGMGIEKIYELLIRLLSEQENVEIKYHLEDEKEHRDKTA